MITTHEDFYQEFTARNTGLISPECQRSLQACRTLVAGCGSTGGAAVEPLTRVGVENFVLVEPDRFELSNLNRQAAGIADIGDNKAEVAALRVRSINPHAKVDVIPAGVTKGNIKTLVHGAGFVIDGVDVTTHSGWQAKIVLHKTACDMRVPVLSGYDLGNIQYARFYDYGRVTFHPFDNQVQIDQKQMTPFALLAQVIPPGFVSRDLISVVQQAASVEFSVPQLVDTAGLFGLIAVRVLTRYLSGFYVAPEIAIDLDELVRLTATPPEPDPVVAAWFDSVV